MRRLPIHTKLAAALAVPLIATGMVTLLEVVKVSGEARQVRGQTELATATIGPRGLITALQNERNFAAANLVGVDKQITMEVTGYPRTRGDTDRTLAEFERELDRRGRRARDAYAPAIDGLASLKKFRHDIDVMAASSTLDLGNIAFTTDVFQKYTTLIAPFSAGMSRLSMAVDDAQLRQGADLMETVTRQIETIPQLANALVLPATVPTEPGDTPGINSPNEIARVSEQLVAFRRQAASLRSASGPFAGIAARYFPVKFTNVLETQATQGLATGHINVNVLLTGLDVPLDQAYLGYRDQVAAALQHRADSLDATAANRQRLYVGLAVVILGAAVLVTWFVSTSITRPLRSLTRQAKDMAERRLPEAVTNILDTPLGEDVQVPQMAPVQVVTRDEVADVADALNTVQDSALDLAVEQAVLRRNIADSFVNLGRRNQNLLGRQLDFITELESTETDPDALGNLFRLDHLATRMRRNAESLLVLAGIEAPRTWAGPVSLTDVIRAAVGEVEDFQRVAIHRVDPATIVGSAASDLAHLLAELVENALAFSPPDQTVDIRGRSHPEGYTLAVIDSGPGMPADDLAAANRRLAGAESFTVAPSKYLGHYVAGNLAARHGIRVHLLESPGNGTTATLDITPTLLEPGAEPAPAAVGPGGQAAAAPPARRPSDSQLASLARVSSRRDPAMPPVPSVPPAVPWGPPAVRAMPSVPPVVPSGPPPPAMRAMPPVPPAMPSGFPQPAPPVKRSWEAPTIPPLTRRVSGTQMPATNPVPLRRPASPAPGAPAPGDARRSAEEVYGFLSTFTAGVRRGLDDAHSPQTAWPRWSGRSGWSAS